MVTIAAEGTRDEPVLRRVCTICGHELGPVHITRGKDRLDAQLRGFNNAARFAPWLVVRDLDRDEDCAPELIRRLLPAPAPQMLFRVSVRAMEAWLLADRKNLANYLSISPDRIPTAPEALDHPKTALVDLARQSRSATVRREMVPRAGSTAKVGIGYGAHIEEFATLYWDPHKAAEIALSLQRCMRALARL